MLAHEFLKKKLTGFLFKSEKEHKSATFGSRGVKHTAVTYRFQSSTILRIVCFTFDLLSFFLLLKCSKN